MRESDLHYLSFTWAIFLEILARNLSFVSKKESTRWIAVSGRKRRGKNPLLATKRTLIIRAICLSHFALLVPSIREMREHVQLRYSKGLSEWRIRLFIPRTLSALWPGKEWEEWRDRLFTVLITNQSSIQCSHRHESATESRANINDQDMKRSGSENVRDQRSSYVKIDNLVANRCKMKARNDQRSKIMLRIDHPKKQKVIQIWPDCHNRETRRACHWCAYYEVDHR